MMDVEIKRSGKGIDDLLRGYIPGTVEVEKPIDLPFKKKYADLFKKYDYYLRFCESHSSSMWFSFKNGMIEPYSTVTEILLPREINAFLQTTISYEEREWYSCSGPFITRLIQNSYNAGYNDFYLYTRNLKPFNLLGAHLRGKLNNRVRSTLLRKKRDNRLRVSIIGDAGEHLGLMSVNCTYNITGDVGGNCGWEANNCTFKTPNEETLEQLQNSVSQNNTIIYIQPNGTEQVIR